MQTKADFLKIASDLISKYPDIEALFNANDPALLWMIESNAAMLGAYSAQIEIAQAEAFEKSRVATVLADAAMRGIIRKATPATFQLQIKNNNTSAFSVETGRLILDSNGNDYVVVTPVTVATGGTGIFQVRQEKTEILTHEVAGSEPFYAIEIPESEDGSFLSAISVEDADGELEYRQAYVNSWANERIYHVEMDDNQKIYVRFGWANSVGIQPIDGTVFTITLTRTFGEILPAVGSPFSFANIGSVSDSNVEITMQSVVQAGQNPVDISILRELAKYPSVYDHNAVYMGEFDFLVRSNFPNLQFLSVWNEMTEENVRGASVDNINCLFVAMLDTNEQTRNQPNPDIPVQPLVIAENNYSATQIAIKNAIKRADDSYRIRFLTPVISKIPMTITAQISTSYVASEVRQKIIEAVLEKYGKTAAKSKKGYNNPLYREVYALLKEKIPALSDGRSDLQVNIETLTGAARPELWRFVDVDSLTVTVTSLNITVPGWR